MADETDFNHEEKPCQFLNLVSVGRMISAFPQLSDLDFFGPFEDSDKLVRSFGGKAL